MDRHAHRELRQSSAQLGRESASRPLLARHGNLWRDSGGLELVKNDKRCRAQARHLQRQEVLQELLAGFGEDRFGMELDAFDFVAAVAEAHDDAVIGFGGDGEFARERFALDDERVIARCREGIGQPAENTLAVVLDLAGLAVKKFRGANDLAAKRNANGLMPKAYAEDWEFPREALD